MKKGGKKERFLSLIGDGLSINEALKEVGADVYMLSDWLEDEEFRDAIDRWRRGMALVVEDALVSAAKRGRTIAAVRYLQSVEPQRWSERMRLEGDLEERRIVKLVFGWEPKDEVRQLGGGVMDVEFRSLGDGGESNER